MNKVMFVIFKERVLIKLFNSLLKFIISWYYVRFGKFFYKKGKTDFVKLYYYIYCKYYIINSKS